MKTAIMKAESFKPATRLITVIFIMIVSLLPAEYIFADECSHQWTAWEIDFEASCNEDGQKSRYCEECGEIETETVPATGKHEWSDWEMDEDPICNKAGTKVRYCDICDKMETKVIPKTGKHIWGDWEVTKNATIKKTGLKERECVECGKTQKKATPKLKAYAKFSKKTYTVKVGKTLKLKVKYAKGDKVKKYKSSNKAVATVNTKGKVKALSAGKAKITVVMRSGRKATCKIKVKAPKKKPASGSDSGWDGTVYWTPSGSVYHKSKSCPTLSRSRTVYSGSIGDSGKSRACKVCS